MSKVKSLENGRSVKSLENFVILLLLLLVICHIQIGDCKATDCNPPCDQITAVCTENAEQESNVIEDREIAYHCVCNYGYEKIDDNKTTTCKKSIISTSGAGHVHEKIKHPLFTETEYQISQIMLYALLGWVVACCFATILYCAVQKAWGHHRVIHLVEELLIIGSYVLTNGLALNFTDNKTACQCISTLIHYFILSLMTAFLLEALFSYGVASGVSPKNGIIPPYLNYPLIFLLPLIPLGISIALTRKHYGSNGIHCWCDLSTSQAWAYFVPITVFFFIASICIESVGLHECLLKVDMADPAQLKWSRKNSQCLIIFMLWLILTYFIGIIGIDQQAFWTVVVYQVLSFLLGPMIFVVHTVGHYEQIDKLPENKVEPMTAAPLPSSIDTEMVSIAQNITVAGTKDTDYGKFLAWVIDAKKGDNLGRESEKILFP